MRRFITLVALVVLSLSRFGVSASAPARASVWSEHQVPRELITSAVRFPGVGMHEAVPRVPSRPTAPWLPLHSAVHVSFAPLIAHPADKPAAAEHSSLGVWARITYDATAPPLIS
jgi:hypothetical protein